MTDSTYSKTPADTLTLDQLNEAYELIKALAPKQAPENMMFLRGATGLNVIKNDMMPSNTVMVSKDLFDLLYEASGKNE